MNFEAPHTKNRNFFINIPNSIGTRNEGTNLLSNDNTLKHGFGKINWLKTRIEVRSKHEHPLRT